ncbi:membrane-bound metal-dependent hydrolase (plasmid) [Methanohalobium evestigatum Z-7303]|uniref:Membrane-bound metal-dependent hydrolase n=1 Tax=Methanohalobium evestigatum (strain ATCC BAA-1072 / DSM 3721 / NBRC 107634 / OCM 161 / Z-7303) TaxID=644295 RepID=D7EC07_METEZ|nr:metal-dependent hydrolase [Methanohalobium evestigatum]ADI75129.1 membrane-bound metal-dependent hydrolase [Methanohalobium evestigatum Z-7303]
MFIFAHIGFTIIIFYLVTKILRLDKPIDYRLVAFVAILPDLVDKGFGILLFPEQVGNGRIYAHTLIFAVLFIVAGDYFVRRRGSYFVSIIGWGFMCHLLLDKMWTIPQTLYWPLLGLNFKADYEVVQTDFSVYIMQVIDNVFTSGLSQVLIFEILGFVITFGFIINYYLAKKSN